MIKLINDILGVCYNHAHDAALSIWSEARKPTPGRPESQDEYTARRKAADIAGFEMVLAECNCPHCLENE